MDGHGTSRHDRNTGVSRCGLGAEWLMCLQAKSGKDLA